MSRLKGLKALKNSDYFKDLIDSNVRTSFQNNEELR